MWIIYIWMYDWWCLCVLCLVSIHYDYASLVLDIFSPSSGGLGAYTLMVKICRKKKSSSSESLRMALEPTRLFIAFGIFYRVEALICDTMIGDLFYFKLGFRILLNSVLMLIQMTWKLLWCFEKSILLLHF